MGKLCFSLPITDKQLHCDLYVRPCCGKSKYSARAWNTKCMCPHTQTHIHTHILQYYVGNTLTSIATHTVMARCLITQRTTLVLLYLWCRRICCTEDRNKNRPPQIHQFVTSIYQEQWNSPDSNTQICKPQFPEAVRFLVASNLLAQMAYKIKQGITTNISI
jgi:hypothetical protein